MMSYNFVILLPTVHSVNMHVKFLVGLVSLYNDCKLIIMYCEILNISHNSEIGTDNYYNVFSLLAYIL